MVIMPQSVFTVQHGVFMYDNCVKYREVVTRFKTQFADVNPSNRDTVRRLANKFRETGSVLDKALRVTTYVLKEDKLGEIRERPKHTPTKCLRRLGQETGISKSTAWRGTKLLHMKPYKITIVHELLPRDPEMRLRFTWLFRTLMME